MTRSCKKRRKISAAGKGLVKIKSILILLPLLVFGCSEPSRQKAAAPSPAPITEEQAMAIVWELPEIKAWTRYIDEKTAGKVRATLMVDPQRPENIRGNKYWAVGFYENQPTHVHRWQTFLVRLDGKEILVDDLVTGDYMDLQKWREKENPFERVREPSRSP